jgi:hypothetical protein
MLGRLCSGACWLYWELSSFSTDIALYALMFSDRVVATRYVLRMVQVLRQLWWHLPLQANGQKSLLPELLSCLQSIRTARIVSELI